MALNVMRTAKSLAVILCLTNYLFIPFDTQVKHSIDKLDWLNLVAYVLIEQLFLASFRRLDYHFVGYIPAVAIVTQIWLRKDEFAFFQAQEMELMFPLVLDAAINVATLVLAINLSNPALPDIPRFQLTYIAIVFGSYLLPTQPAKYLVNGFWSRGTIEKDKNWEQFRLVLSFLSLRLAAGGLLQAIVLTASERWDLRIGILRSRCNLDLDEPGSDLKGENKPGKEFAVNVNIAMILAGGLLLAVWVIAGAALSLTKLRIPA